MTCRKFATYHSLVPRTACDSSTRPKAPSSRVRCVVLRRVLTLRCLLPKDPVARTTRETSAQLLRKQPTTNGKQPSAARTAKASHKKVAKKTVSKKKPGKPARAKYTARNADKHELYQLSVQD